jgi:hypothetical protein
LPLDEAAVRVMGPVGTSDRRRPLHRSELIDQADCRSDDAAFYSMHSSPNWGRRRVLFTLLLGNTSRHRGVGSLLWSSPHHLIGRTPAQSPSCGGALFGTVDRSCVQWAAGPDCSPHHSVPHARQSGPPPSNRISEISVRLFMARTLAPLPFCPLDLFLGEGVKNKQHCAR